MLRQPRTYIGLLLCAFAAMLLSAAPQPPAIGGIQVVFQTGHASQIDSLAMSPDGRYILSSSRDETAKLWDVAGGRELRTFAGLASGADQVAFAGDSGRLIIGGVAGRRLIDATTGRTLRQLSETFGMTVVSSNGRFAVSRQQDKRGSVITVTDLTTDQVVATIPATAYVAPTAVSNDGRVLLLRRIDVDSRRILTAVGEGKTPLPNFQLEVWDIRSKKLSSKLQFADKDPYSQSYQPVLSPDGRLMVVNSFDGKLKFYDVATSAKQFEIDVPTDANSLGWGGALIFSADGRLLANARGNSICVWDIPSGRLVTKFAGASIAFSADARTLIVGRSTGGAPILRDLASGRETPLVGGTSAIVELAIAGDGNSVIAATETGGARHWDLTTGQLIRTFECPGGTGATSVSASAAGPWFAMGCADGAVYLWNLGTGKLIRTVSPPLSDKLYAVTHVRFDRSGHRLAATINEQLAVWDAVEGGELQRITLPRIKSPFNTLDEKTLAQMPEMLRKQAAETMANPQAIATMNAPRSMAVDPEGKLIAVGKDSALLLFDVASGQLVRQFTKSASREQEPPPSPEQALVQRFHSGERLTRKELKELVALQKSGRLPMAMTRDPEEEFDDALGDIEGAFELEFSPDGRLLLAQGERGKQVWEVQTGRRIREPHSGWIDASDPNAYAEREMDREAGSSRGLAVSPDGRFAARGHGNTIEVWDIASEQTVASFVGHTSAIASLAYTAGGRLLVSGSSDGTVRIWDVPEGKELIELIALGSSDYVAVTPDQYYRASKRRISGVAFRVNDKIYPFEQFDLRFNRPDIVLERLGFASAEVVWNFRTAYERRLKKMGFTESMLTGEFHLPEVAPFDAAVPVTTAAATLPIRVRAIDDRYPLDRINVFVNDVPIFGTAGLAVADRQAQKHEQDVAVPLVPGRNKIQVSVLNQQGAESLKQTAYTTSTATPDPADVYVVAIGVSQYENPAYNLRFAAKDATDLMNAYRAITERERERVHGQVHLLDLTNAKATRSGIRQAKEWLKQARTNDLVVVFAAGHGMTDDQQNYYFGTYDIDPAHPAASGLPYEDFEGLLDGIAPLKKVLLIDTCFSGEIEKDEATVVAQAQTEGAGTVSMRAFKAARGVTVVADSGNAGATAPVSGDLVRFQQELFADLRRGTGAVVISSASGNEYALEGEQWSNGVFTYALLNGLKNGQADTNKDESITVSELQAYVIDEVHKLTAGGQNPTVRRENLDYDFAVF